MKHWIRRLVAAAALCTLAACSSATDTSTEDKSTSTETASEEASSTETTSKEASNTETTSKEASSTDTTDSAETAALTLNEAGESLAKALKDQGYTVYDLDIEYDEYSFKIRNDTGASEVDIQKYASAAAALYEYQDETGVWNDEDFYVEQTYENGSKQYSTLRNSINYIWGIEAVDQDNALTYSIEEIPNANMDSIEAALNAVGFTK